MDRKIKWASVVGAVAGVLSVLAAFGVDVSSDQQQVVADALMALGPVAAAVFAGYFTHASESDPSRETAVE